MAYFSKSQFFVAAGAKIVAKLNYLDANSFQIQTLNEVELHFYKRRNAFKIVSFKKISTFCAMRL